MTQRYIALWSDADLVVAKAGPKKLAGQPRRARSRWR